MSDGNESFLLKLPLYCYLLEPGPRPGFLRDPDRGVVFVPLWTDFDLFETYLKKLGLAGKVSGLRLHSREELITFLLRLPDEVQHVTVDPNHKVWQGMAVFERSKLREPTGVSRFGGGTGSPSVATTLSTN